MKLSVQGAVGFVFLVVFLQSSNGEQESDLLTVQLENEHQKITKNYNYNIYHKMEEIEIWMTQIVTDYPDIASTHVLGKSFENRNITFLKIGIESESPKKAIWMDCGIHAREWIAPAFCQWFVKEVLQSYKSDAQMHELLTNLDFYVTPVLNVDGYMYTWKDISNRLWRKSRSTLPADCTCNGVDLNRNFDASWGTVGVSTNCCSIIYCGTGPNSEPETKAVSDFVSSKKNDILCFLTIHSHGQLLLIPYGQKNNKAPNYEQLMDLGRKAAQAIKNVHGMEYRVGSTADILYENSGSSRDWARDIGIEFSYTFELRDNGTYGFELPENQIQPTCEEVYAGAKTIITYVHDNKFKSAAVATVALWTTLLSSYVSYHVLI